MSNPSSNDVDILVKLQEYLYSCDFDIFNEREDVDLFAILAPQRDLSGDFYDFFFTDDTHLVFFMGDLTYEGPETALIAFYLRTVLHELGMQELSPAHILDRANKALIELFDETIASCWVGVLNTHSGKFRYCDAGYNAPLLVHSNAAVLPLSSKKNLMLGVKNSTVYKDKLVMLDRNTTVFLYTKGILQQINEDAEAYGTQNLYDTLRKSCSKKPKELIYDVASHLIDFTQGVKQTDDISMLALNFSSYRDCKLTCCVKDINSIDSYGGVTLSLTTKELEDAGIHYADLVTITWLEHSIKVPVVPNYRFLNTGTLGLIAWPNPQDKLLLCGYGTNFSKQFNFEAQDHWPLQMTLELTQTQGFQETYEERNMSRDTKRESYSHLSDEEFGNFREISLGAIKPGRLFRSSTPISTRLGRNTYVDNALYEHQIKTIFNLADSIDMCRHHKGFEKSYYATCDIHCCSVDSDYHSGHSQMVFASVFRKMLKCAPPMLIHCVEGQDRTGFLIAIIECLCDASLSEVVDDYSCTFYNFYGVEKGSIGYANISHSIIEELEEAFQVDALSLVDLNEAVRNYLARIGLTNKEIALLKSVFCD